jgi:LuxR family transcriptional regulator, maltose regulon positive regulatory protein
MQRMLRRLEEQGHSEVMTRRILAAFQEKGKDLPGNDSPTQPAHRTPLGNSTLVEPLTPRELEVLTLLREPLSIKEIALKLYISYATARRHTINLYGKLHVNQRWNAVTRILPPD